MRVHSRRRARVAAVVLVAVAAAMIGLAVARELPIAYVASTCSVRPGAGYAVTGYRPLAVDEHPYARTAETALDLDDPRYDVGPDGVVRQAWAGHRGGYHPVNMEWYALYLLESYRATDRTAHLDRAIGNAEALLAGGQVVDGIPWFAYHFDYRLHGDVSMALEPPWYSGMAQGLALSLFVRLHQETGEARWADAAEGTFRSFLGEFSQGEPQFRLERNNGCLWFEEYVDDQIAPIDVVNRHIYAVFGLYDYTRTSDDPRAIDLFDAGATTIRESFDSFRVPGDVSLYCATEYCARTQWMPSSYHRGAAAQLDILAAMTGDPTFADQAATLRADTAT